MVHLRLIINTTTESPARDHLISIGLSNRFRLVEWTMSRSTLSMRKKVAVTIKTMTNKREPITQVGSLSCSYPFVHAINLS